MRKLGIGLVWGVVAVGCSKPGGQTAPDASASAAAAAPSVAAAASAAPETTPTAATAAAAPAGAESAPASFKGGTKETVANAVGLGCEATSLDGWLQLLCRKKNGTGGHPVKATIKDPNAAPAEAAAVPPAAADAPPAAETASSNELTANEQGELTIVVPYHGDEKRDVEIEWTDTTYTLHVTGAKASLEWAASGIPHRKACQQVLDETKAVIAAAQKAEGEARLTTTEASKLPRFGVCQPGGLGSWALALKKVSGKGEGAKREEHLELEAVRVALDGARQSARFGSFDVAPGGLELGALQVYDYDDDGHDELIVPYEVKAALTAPDVYPAPIWTFTDAGVSAYAKAPPVHGGIAIEQLDFDMRPDFSGYGGYVAFLSSDCGAKTCPARLTGPKLYWHSTPEGGFADSDEAARTALKRAMCQSKPQAAVVEAGGAVNAAQTAKNLVCLRAYGASIEAITAELTTKHASLCGDATTCPLQTTLETWAKVALPVSLAQPTKQ